MDALLAASDYEGLKKLIENNNIVCGISGTSNWTDVRQFNLMFSTQMGSVSDEADVIYLRPETAQGHLCKFFKCAENRAHEDPVRHCTDR
jgi:glycyl-tRNA synthetase